MHGIKKAAPMGFNLEKYLTVRLYLFQTASPPASYRVRLLCESCRFALKGIRSLVGGSLRRLRHGRTGEPRFLGAPLRLSDVAQ